MCGRWIGSRDHKTKSPVQALDRLHGLTAPHPIMERRTVFGTGSSRSTRYIRSAERSQGN